MIKKSIFASLAIAMGVAVLLTMGQPLGPVLFALGLIAVCFMKGNLYTGKCGYVIENGNYTELGVILLVNMVAGWIFGAAISVAKPDLIDAATKKVESWNDPLAHFVLSIFCGVIMFMAVDIYKKGSPLGIIYGIPLFIFCGFQHCIANIITLGVARTFSPYIFISIVGNLVGSLGVWLMVYEKKIEKKQETNK